MSQHASNESTAGASAGVTRRSFLRSSALALSGIAAVAAALEPLRDINDPLTLKRFFQKHYKQMTPEDMEKVLARISAEVYEQYKIRPHVKDYKPMDGVEFVYCLNLTRCIGCRKCVHACVAENNQSRSPEIQYIRVLKMPYGSMEMEKGDHNYSPDQVPEKGF